MQRVFISHNSKDKAFVRKLAEALKEHGVECWVDEAEIRFGESLVQKISHAIDSIDLVIAVISNNSVYSNWVRQELDWAMTKEIKGNKVVVIPVIIDRCDVPFFLANKLYADFTDNNKFGATLRKLVDSIQYHVSHRPADCDEPSFGESVSLRYHPTNLPAAICALMIVVCLCGIAATYAYFRGAPHSPATAGLPNYIYTFFIMTIAALLAELLRIAMVRYQTRSDPAFAQDAGMIQVASLLFRNYRLCIARHWPKLLTKACVVIEILVWALIIMLVAFALKIASFL